MTNHRVRLTDDELSLITSALRACWGGVGEQTGAKLLRLAERLEEAQPGNPDWRLGPQTVKPHPKRNSRSSDGRASA